MLWFITNRTDNSLVLIMPRRPSETECDNKKKVSHNGTRLPDPIREGEVFTDSSQKQWRIGRSIGVGGFGEIYLGCSFNSGGLDTCWCPAQTPANASDNTAKPVSLDTPSVIKVEPHQNGPLFVEMNFYVRSAKPSLIEEWKQQKGLTHLGLSPYHGSGSHVYLGERYRFIVIERFGPDLNKLFLQSNRRFHLKTVLYLGVQILDALEYIHSKGYCHADIKGSNLLLGHRKGAEHQVHLLDFGLAIRFAKNGRHVEFWQDERRAHDGTLEFTSRDAHHGAHSRRGDLETLGYNLLQWLCGRLPWEDAATIVDPEYVHLQKKTFMNNIPQLMRRCFPHSQSPAVMEQYLKYVNSLGFETKPDYSHCRKLLRQGIKDSHFVDDGKLVFGANPKVPLTKKRPMKRKSAEEPENMCDLKPRKMSRNILRQPCVAHNFNSVLSNNFYSSITKSDIMTRNSMVSPVLRSHQFDWAKVLSSNPEKILFPEKKKTLLTTVTPGSRVAHKIRRRLLSAAQDKEGDDPALVEGPYPREEDVLRNPTPAMQEVMSRLRQKVTPTPTWVQKHKADSRCVSPVERPRPLSSSRYRLPLTPAMEWVIKRRELLKEQTIRTTRSVSAARRKSVTLTSKTMAIVSSVAKKRTIPRSSQVRKKTLSPRVLRKSTALRG
uniref:non-specific serine/threonine protein kinase n=1 Tax=Timema bartmani TaxID=61472 RepID=A0A7R9F2G3_9NEOP|nr:unnamed protein product [Timema bartmani]